MLPNTSQTKIDEITKKRAGYLRRQTRTLLFKYPTPTGKHKALLFQKRLGITIENKEILEQALLQAALENDAIIYKQDRYGVHYDVKFVLQTEVGSSLILSSWIIRKNETSPG